MKSPHRDPMVAKIHIAKKDLGLDDETYRDVLVRVTGKASSKGLSDGQLDAVLAEFKRLGWQAPAGQRKKSDKPYVRLIFALWGELKRMGVLDSPTTSALRAFCARQAGTGDAATDPEFLTAAQATPVIEALKSWIARTGGGDGR